MAQHCGEMQYVCFGYSALSSWWNWIIPHQCTFLPRIHLLFQMYVYLQMHCRSFLCQRLNITILCHFSISHACTVDICIVIIYRYLYLQISISRLRNMNGSSSRAARLVLAIFMSHSATRYLHLLAGVLCLYPRYLQTLISPTIELWAILQRIRVNLVSSLNPQLEGVCVSLLLVRWKRRRCRCEYSSAYPL